MSISLILIVAIGVMTVTVLFLFGRSAAGAGITEPSCGKCGYCVRGISQLTCPECGSDLREVGIRTAGSTHSLSPRARLLVWTLLVPAPGMLLGMMLGSTIGPRTIATTQRRAIFCQTTYLNLAFNVTREGSKVVWGNAYNRPAPLQTMEISARGVRPMKVNLADGKYAYTDAAGKTITGTFDATAIGEWLNDNGKTDPRVAERADDIAAAIAGMDGPTANKFAQYPPDSLPGNHPGVQGHPSVTFSHPTNDALTFVSPIVLTLLIWLAGLPLVLRGRRTGATSPAAAPFAT